MAKSRPEAAVTRPPTSSKLQAAGATLSQLVTVAYRLVLAYANLGNHPYPDPGRTGRMPLRGCLLMRTAYLGDAEVKTMKAPSLLLRVYGECRDGQWTLLCLDFDLVAQASTLAEAQNLLQDQIAHYVADATVGPDAGHAGALLRRRSPLKYWLSFYYHCARAALLHHPLRTRRAELRPLPLVPAVA